MLDANIFENQKLIRKKEERINLNGQKKSIANLGKELELCMREIYSYIS